MDTSCRNSTGISQSHASSGTTRGPSEVGMDGPAAVKHLGSFSIGTDRQLSSHLGNEFDRIKTSGIPVPIFKQTCAFSSRYRQLGEKRLPSGMTGVDISAWNWASGQPVHITQSNSRPQISYATLLQQHPLPVHGIEASISSPSKLQDQTVASGTPIAQRDADVYAMEGWSTNGHGEVPLSADESGRGKQGLHFLSLDPMKHSASNVSSSPLKTSGHTQDHIMAERKRREKLTQRFIALSAILPDLKRTDKASILGDTIKYVKRLQERMKLLEGSMQKKPANSYEHMRGPKNIVGSSDVLTEVGVAVGNSEPPEIEVRMVDKNVLIRVHCEKRKGILLKSVGELEKLELVVLNANVLSFTEHNFDFTFNAQVGEGSELTADDIIKALRAVLTTTI